MLCPKWRMERSSRHPREVRERAVALVLERRSDYGSQWEETPPSPCLMINDRATRSSNPTHSPTTTQRITTIRLGSGHSATVTNTAPDPISPQGRRPDRASRASCQDPYVIIVRENQHSLASRTQRPDGFLRSTRQHTTRHNPPDRASTPDHPQRFGWRFR
jgi:hypothetical protein